MNLPKRDTNQSPAEKGKGPPHLNGAHAIWWTWNHRHAQSQHNIVVAQTRQSGGT